MERGDCPDDSTFAELIEHALDAERLGAVGLAVLSPAGRET